VASGWGGVGLTLVGAIVIGYLSFRFVEAPALARKARRTNERTAGTSADPDPRIAGWVSPS
jgi:peptidoglycan/LPS O-acetylase OafA/YrhL